MIRQTRLRCHFAVILTLALSAGQVLCEDEPDLELYVDPVNGDDTNSGASWETSLKTLTKAAEQAGHARAAVYLAEGVCSEASGEVFPIEFDYAPDMYGASRDTTIIDGGVCTTMIWSTDWSGGSFTRYFTTKIRDITFQASQIQQTEGMSAVVNLAADTLSMESVRFLRMSCLGRSVLGVLATEGLRFVDCEFLDFDGHWMCLMVAPAGGERICHRVFMERCVVRGAFQGEVQDASASYFPFPEIGTGNVYIGSCRFVGTGEWSRTGFYGTGYDSGDTLIRNCSFENLDLLLSATDVSGSNIVGCSFKNTQLDVEYWPDALMYYSVFDESSSITVGEHTLYLKWSCIPFEPDSSANPGLYIREPLSRDDPVFVHGPLGGCYLSNVESGQASSSPCLGHWPYRDQGWPPDDSTTRTDGVPDKRQYDIGYHYPSVPPPPPSVLVETDRQEYAPGDEMVLSGSFENRGVLVEGGIYVALTPESLDWFMYWPSIGFSPTPVIEGNLYSGVAYPMAQFDTLEVPISLSPGQYWWLAAVVDQDGAFASDISVWPITITAPVAAP